MIHEVLVDLEDVVHLVEGLIFIKVREENTQVDGVGGIIVVENAGVLVLRDVMGEGSITVLEEEEILIGKITTCE